MSSIEFVTPHQATEDRLIFGIKTIQRTIVYPIKQLVRGLQAVKSIWQDKRVNIWGVLHIVAIMGIAAFVLPFMIVASILADLCGTGKVKQSIILAT
jgi:hypothetical protein